MPKRASNHPEVDVDSMSYKAGRRDALHSIYVVLTGRPNILRDEAIELIRIATLDAERKLRDTARE